MEHTPGPWIKHISETDKRLKVLHPDGSRLIADLSVGFNSPKDGPIPSDEREANACLIAAAPDLLEACQSVIDHWHGNFKNFSKKEPMHLELCRNAIAKAKGE